MRLSLTTRVRYAATNLFLLSENPLQPKQSVNQSIINHRVHGIVKEEKIADKGCSDRCNKSRLRSVLKSLSLRTNSGTNRRTVIATCEEGGDERKAAELGAEELRAHAEDKQAGKQASAAAKVVRAARGKAGRRRSGSWAKVSWKVVVLRKGCKRRGNDHRRYARFPRGFALLRIDVYLTQAARAERLWWSRTWRLLATLKNVARRDDWKLKPPRASGKGGVHLPLH